MQPSTYGTARAFFAELTFIEIRRLCKNLDPEHIPDKPIVCGSFQPGMTKIELMESCLRQPGRGFCRACYAFKDAARKKDKYVSKAWQAPIQLSHGRGMTMFHRTLHAQLPQKASTSSTGASLDRPLLRGCGDAIHQAELRELTNANRLGRPDLICSNEDQLRTVDALKNQLPGPGLTTSTDPHDQSSSVSHTGDQTLTHHGSRRQPNASLAQQILLSAAASLGLSTNMPTALMESSLCSELVQLQNATPVFGKQGSSEQTKCDRCRREFFLKCVKVEKGGSTEYFCQPCSCLKLSERKAKRRKDTAVNEPVLTTMTTVMPSEIDDLLRLLRDVGLPEDRLNLLSHKVAARKQRASLPDDIADCLSLISLVKSIKWDPDLHELQRHLALITKLKDREIASVFRSRRPRVNAIVAALQEALDRGQYVAFNFSAQKDSSLSKVFAEMLPPDAAAMDADQPDLPFLQAFWRVRDPLSLSLLLLGQKGSGSGWHRDPGGAHNIAFRWEKIDNWDDALALWLFVHPGQELQVQQWQETRLKIPFGHEKLSASQCQQLIDALGTGKAAVIDVVRQHHGDMVVVPPGTVHLVTNLQDCCKLAVEVAQAEHLALYFQAAHVHDNRFFGELNSDDYLKLPEMIILTARLILAAWR